MRIGVREPMVKSIDQIDQNEEDRSDSTSLSVKKKPLCQVEGCTVDLTSEKAYCIKRRLCSDHIRADAVYCRGQEGLWRFCFQCGKLEPLSRFEGNKRSCRTRLAQRKQRETRKCLSDLAYRYNRASRAPTFSSSKLNKPSNRRTITAPFMQGSLQDVHSELQVSLQHPQRDAVSSVSPFPVSPLDSPSQSQPCMLPTVQEEMFEGTVSAPLVSPLDPTAYAGSRVSPFSGMPAVPEPATAAAMPVIPTGQFFSNPAPLAPAQQSLGAGLLAPSSAAMAASGDHSTVLVPAYGNFGALQGSLQAPQPHASRSCMSAPLPAVPAAYLPARACTPAVAPAAPAGGDIQSADAVARYATLLDDLLLEMNSDSSAVTVPAAVNHAQSLMQLEDLPLDDLLHEHSDDELRQVLEAALEHAAAPLQQQNQQQQVGMVPAASALQQSDSVLQPQLPAGHDSLQVIPVAGLSRHQQQALLPTAALQNGFSSLSPATIQNAAVFSRPAQLQDQRLFSSNSMHGWATINSGNNSLCGPHLEIPGTGSATVGSFAMNGVPNRAGAGVHNAQGPAVAPVQQQLDNSARQLQKIQQQQQLLQKVRSHVTGAMANAMTANGTAASAPEMQLYRTELQMVEEQLSEMQDILHVMKLETMTLESATSTCC